MKKKMRLAAAVMASAVLLGACGSKEYVKDIQAEKYVTLGEYKGIELEEVEPSVSDEYVDSYIEYLLSQSLQEVDKPDKKIEEGDIVNIDYAGYDDGVAFDGGTGSANLTIGSGQFIDGFEEGLIGHTVGEKVSLNLTFPDPYSNPDLAGKAVVFEVTINSFMETPALNDEYIASLGMEDCDTVEKFREYIRSMFYLDAAASYEQKLANDITNTVMSNCTFKELPEELVERYYSEYVESISRQAAAQNMALSQYLSYYQGIDITANPNILKEYGKAMAQQIVMFQAIADAEGITITDAELEEEMEDRVSSYGYASVDEFKESVDIEFFRENLISQKVMDFLKENADITMVSAEEAAEKAQEAAKEAKENAADSEN